MQTQFGHLVLPNLKMHSKKFKIEVEDVFIIYPLLVPNLIILQIYFTRLDGLIWQLGDDLIGIY